ncbi:hypothetical protein ACLSU7_14535 [Bdellovibrio sp. HCB185ZH]|uniref:hypothetical protein n=1 Tax=Bdellovibrio sp. HCB185ZH TaxID=3394235 RepID=UPI0039A40EC6
MQISDVRILDIATDLYLWSMIGISLHAVWTDKSTRTLFSISLWSIWLSVAGWALLPSQFTDVMQGTTAGILGLLFLNSMEYRSKKVSSRPLE